jgi:hypothetical protein
VSQKKLPKPAWYKNTYFWISGILFILFIVGLLGGDATIRDPGQKREGMLWLLYLVASGIMLLNGVMSHSQTVQHYRETVGDADETPKTVAKTASLPSNEDAVPIPMNRVPEPDKVPEAPQINTEESNQP